MFRTGTKIIGIGRNYAYLDRLMFSDHAKELGNAIPASPFFFLKPTSSYLVKGAIEIPTDTVVHHEIELGVCIGKDGRDISEDDAMNYIDGYCLALDMTARDVQDAARKQSLPWSAAKGYDTFTPVGEFIEKSRVIDPHSLNLSLKINGKTVQDGNTRDMIFSIPRLIHHVSTIMSLNKGDLILTGTPKGVGPIAPGQTLTGGLVQDSILISSFSFETKAR